MYLGLLYLLLWFNDNGSIEKNNLKNLARLEVVKNLSVKNYIETENNLQKISKLSLIQNPEVTFDLAQVYFSNQKYAQAQQIFESINHIDDQGITTKVWLQLGVIYATKGDTTQALNALKNSLAIMPENELARHNFEVLSKIFKPKNNSPEQKSEAKSKEIEKPSPQKELEMNEKAQKLALLKKLNDYHLSPEKAETILETIKNAEVQYVQQRKRNITNKKENASGEWW